MVGKGEFFLIEPSLLPAAVLFRLEPVEGDEVQAAVTPPAPGLVPVIMVS